jgi:hypothetical protein
MSNNLIYLQIRQNRADQNEFDFIVNITEKISFKSPIKKFELRPVRALLVTEAWCRSSLSVQTEKQNGLFYFCILNNPGGPPNQSVSCKIFGKAPHAIRTTNIAQKWVLT